MSARLLDFMRLPQISLPMGTGWLLASCMEMRGKQDLWIKQKPEVLRALREQAIIQSVESSNRIAPILVPVQAVRWQARFRFASIDLTPAGLSPGSPDNKPSPPSFTI